MNGPKLWADMLEAINIPGAVVAGGCIRDCFLNVAPKDIDIFVPFTSREDMISKLFEQPEINGDDIFASISSGINGNPRFGTLEMLEPGEHANAPGRRFAEYDDAFGEGGTLHGVAEGNLWAIP
jgi:tRNA nucleotidyltransferase/poly(A) polymerase